MACNVVDVPTTATSVRASRAGNAARAPASDSSGEGAHRLELARLRRVVPDEPLGEPDAAHLDRGRGLGARRSQGELGRTTTDVEHEERGRRIEPPRRADERELGLPLPRDDLQVRAGLREHGPLELVPVGGIPHRGGGGDADPRRVQRPRPAAVGTVDGDRPLQRVGPQSAGPVDVLAEPRDHHVARQLPEGAHAVRLDDEQSHRVRALIDHGEPVVPLLVDGLDPFGGPRPHGVLAPREVVGVVRVQALHAGARAADPTARLGPVGSARALARVRRVGLGDRSRERGVGLDALVQPRDRPARLHARDRPGGRRDT